MGLFRCPPFGSLTDSILDRPASSGEYLIETPFRPRSSTKAKAAAALPGGVDDADATASADLVSWEYVFEYRLSGILAGTPECPVTSDHVHSMDNRAARTFGPSCEAFDPIPQKPPFGRSAPGATNLTGRSWPAAGDPKPSSSGHQVRWPALREERSFGTRAWCPGSVGASGIFALLLAGENTCISTSE